ncbi:MAG: endolytic transglycosylase MltG [Salinivirgaceae bacterium]|nr:endolytic transglycosylase MltG [Salinivirgaceae bacterium]
MTVATKGKTKPKGTKKHSGKKGRKSTIKVVVLIALVALVAGSAWLYKRYTDFNGANINLQGRQTAYIHIPKNAKFNDVVKLLTDSAFVTNIESFKWVADLKKYPTKVKPGRYKIRNGMSNNQLIDILRSGKQETIRITINKFRSLKSLADLVGSKIEAKPNEIYKLLIDNNFLQQYGLNKETAYALFIPDTYYFEWGTSAEEFLARMNTERNKFWNEQRTSKAQNAQMSPVEVYILASIVEEETNKDSEKPDVAGVYVNRLHRGMPLQADPTVKFALNNFEIKRILNKHLQTNSPYNTYKNKGLPPGPICTPSKTTIDAVLNYNKHKYLYFCAKDDFSGYHTFANTLIEHNKNAEKYRKALNKRKIYK